MALKYPQNFNTNMPMIHFKAYEYLCPKPTLGVLETTDSKVPADVDEIFLYMPGDFTESIASDWAMEDMYLGGTGQGLSADAMANISNAFKNIDGGKLQANVSAMAGRLPFPSDINVFKGVQPMSFNLSFNMIPYDVDEATAILAICNTFKLNMLPDPDGDLKNQVLRFPCIWDLTFDNINGVGVNREATYELMIMNSCTVNFVSGQEGASVYHDGNPTQVRLSLGFQSLRRQFYGGV
jgi:hypothetical protein